MENNEIVSQKTIDLTRYSTKGHKEACKKKAALFGKHVWRPRRTPSLWRREGGGPGCEGNAL